MNSWELFHTWAEWKFPLAFAQLILDKSCTILLTFSNLAFFWQFTNWPPKSEAEELTGSPYSSLNTMDAWRLLYLSYVISQENPASNAEPICEPHTLIQHSVVWDISSDVHVSHSSSDWRPWPIFLAQLLHYLVISKLKLFHSSLLIKSSFTICTCQLISTFFHSDAYNNTYEAKTPIWGRWRGGGK